MQANGDQRRLFGWAIAVVAAVTLARIVVLVASPLELYPDEAQYWWWAQTPDFGYFSKPPLIAWIIRATTIVFGDREWAIRLGMPLLHAGASLLLFGVARAAFPKSPPVAFWSALAYLTLPGVSYSSMLASTDAPLLFFWALALFAFVRAVQSSAWRWALLCGLALGLGILAKYAMLFFLLGMAAVAAISPRVRKFAGGPRGWSVVAIAALVVAPNIEWNFAHDFATVAHTQTNAGWVRADFNPLRLLAFLAGQFGVFGPLLMGAWLARLYRIAREPDRSTEEITLAVLSVPTLALIAIQALVAGANANWAATSYVAAVPLAVAEILTLWPRAILWFSFGLHGLVLVLLWLVLLSPQAADRLGLGNVFKREEGWRALSGQVSLACRRGGFSVVAADNRSVTAELLYYMPRHGPTLRIWDPDIASHNHFDMTMRLTRPVPRTLLVLAPEDASEVLATFESSRLIGNVAVPVGGRHVRTMSLFDARDYRGPLPHP